MTDHIYFDEYLNESRGGWIAWTSTGLAEFEVQEDAEAYLDALNTE